VEVTLLERNPISFGGRVAQYPPERFTFRGQVHEHSMEHGIHGWWRQYRNFLGLIERRGLGDRLIDAYDQTILFHDGKEVYRTNVGRETQITPVPEPMHHAQLLFKKNIRRMIGVRELPAIAVLARRVMECLAFDPRDERHRELYDRLAVVDYTDGLPFFFQSFLKSLTRGGFFSDPPLVSLWAFLLSLQLYVFLRKEDQCFAFVRGPVMRELFEPLMGEIRESGGHLARGITVDGVRRDGGEGWVVSWSREPGIAAGAPGFARRMGEFHARQLVLAVDVEGAKALLAGSPDLAPVLGDLSVFQGRRATTVRLWWSRAAGEEYGESGVFAGRATADNYFWLHRFQDESEAWHRATGGAISECHVYAPDRLHDKSDEELLDRVQRDMERGFPELAGSCIHRAIVRNRGTHINFPVGCAVSFPGVTTAHDDLVLCGDWIDGGVPVLYMERACQTAILAANTLLTRRDLEPWPVAEPLPPPRHIQQFQRLLRGIEGRFPAVWRSREQGPRRRARRVQEVTP